MKRSSYNSETMNVETGNKISSFSFKWQHFCLIQATTHFFDLYALLRFKKSFWKLSFLFQYSLISTKPPWTKAWCYANVQPYTHSRSPLCWLQMFSSASITISWVSKSSSQPPSLSSVPHHRPHCQHRCKIYEQLTWNSYSDSGFHMCIFQWIDWKVKKLALP